MGGIISMDNVLGAGLVNDINTKICSFYLIMSTKKTV
jgi:hypothetical protein